MAADTKSLHCKACQSRNQKTFTGEIAIHFPGLAGLKKPIVWVFPHVSICLDCGFAEFSTPDRELEVLRTGTPVKGAVVWLGRKQESGDVDGDGDEGRDKVRKACVSGQR